MSGDKKLKDSVIPFKIYRYPNSQSQYLQTKRKQIKLRMPYVHSQTNRPTIETDISGKILNSPSSVDEMLSTFRSRLSEHSTELLPKFETNIDLLKSLKWKSNLSMPKLQKQNIFRNLKPLKKKTKEDPKLISKRSKESIDIYDIINGSPNKQSTHNFDSFHDIDDFEFEKKKESQDSSYGYWYIKNPSGTRPSSREESQLVVLNKKAYIYGGQSRIKQSDVKELDIISWSWSILSTDYSPHGISGHSMIAYKRNLVIFGGTSSHSKNLGIRRCSNKIGILSLKENKWQFYKGSNDWPSPRRNHAFSSLGRNMLIYGGISQDGEFLDDLWIFDIKEKSWILPEMTTPDCPCELSHATLTPVFFDIVKEDSSISILSVSKTHQSIEINNSGFYLFGGHTYDGAASNKLYGLYVREGKLLWLEIAGNGNPPVPRYGHSACAIKFKIYIFGGRNDSMFNTYGDSCLNELNVFNVETLTWEKIEIHGSSPEGRWGHTMAGYGTRILLFGGMCHKKYMTSDLYCLETCRDIAEDLHKTDRPIGMFEVSGVAKFGIELKALINNLIKQKN